MLRPHLTRLHDNVLWSARANLLSVPTDCPQRDERLGWTGDAQIFAATAALNFRALEFFRKWLRDVRDAITADGSVPNVAPDVLTTSLAGSHDGAAGWGDAIVIVPWEMYQAYGDRSILVENLDAMAGWLAYLERNSEGLIRPAEGFGDWLAFDPTPLDLVATAFYHRAALLASRCAAAVDDERADGWDALAGRVRDAWRERFLRDGLPSARTQGAAVLALHFGLLDDHEIPAVAADLAALLEENRFRLSTGFLTTPYLLPALTQVGRDDVALRVLLGDAPPSWLYPVKHGDATSMWERWDSWTEEGGFQDPAMNSFNHYAYGAVDEWICDRIGGIRRTGPAYASVEISPLPSREITSASHARTTPYGRIAVEWETDGDELRIRTEIPDGVIPTFVTPAGYAARSLSRICSEWAVHPPASADAMSMGVRGRRPDDRGWRMTADGGTVSIRDVAAAAGVSVATVSNVLNSTGRFSEKTKHRVEEAIRELGFVRNRSAFELRTKEKAIIGLLVPNLANSFFASMARGSSTARPSTGCWSSSPTASRTRITRRPPC
ncbi:alpha-L-rhamnosidase-related protein [Tessaracoccus coleopterorum]|uniref:alpha-L-rhamnosidase-related protein n=1 Tax=Tessaracoccus coleopterorum TaxID=2714950 RepID=UPI002F917E87